MINYGRIIDIDELTRTVTLKSQGRLKTLYIQRSLFNQFYKFLMPDHYIVYTTRPPRSIKHQHHDNVKDLLRIIKPTKRKRRVLYSHDKIQNQLKLFINSLGNRMYLDMEMSMHPYTVDKYFTQEIIQVGYVLVDENDNVIEKYRAFIKPKLHETLTKRTLKFLDLTQQDIDQGIDFTLFYNHLKAHLKKYNPAIIVWGKNDEIALKEATEIHKLKPLNGKIRFVNLLKLHKNYYRLKDDLGLLTAYKLYGGTLDNQRHDALDDALMTKIIYEGFKAVINEEAPLPTLLQKS